MNKLALLFVTLLLASANAHASFFDPDWEVYNNVPYGPSAEEIADLYLLKSSNNPVILFIHGGGWSAGDKSVYAGYYANLYGWAGFSVVSINYRLAVTADANTHWPAQLQDAQLAVRWLRQYASTLRIDPDRIAAFGDSAGAHLALFLGSLNASVPGDRSDLFGQQKPNVSVVVDMFGPTDLTDPAFLVNFQQPPLFGGLSYSQAPALYEDASPKRLIGPQTAPTVIVQGMADTIVPPKQSVDLRDQLQALKVSVTWLPFNGGHWFVGLTPSSEKTNIDNAAMHAVSDLLHPNPWAPYLENQ